jgi:hypothetical protein
LIVHTWLAACLCVFLPSRAAWAASGGSGVDPNKGLSAQKQVDARMQEFFSRIEQAMRDWPREDISDEQPLDKQIHAQIKHLCDEIQQSTEQHIREASFPHAKVGIRSMYYVVQGSDRCIRVAYSGKSDTENMRSEFIFCDINLELHDGRLRLRPESGRQVSPFADVMIPILWGQTQSTLESASYPTPLSWPIVQETHNLILHQTKQLLDLYLGTLKDLLEPSDGFTGQIERISYEFWFEEHGELHAMIRVTFDVKGTQEDWLRPGVELDYKAGQVRLKNVGNPSWSRGTEYVRDASANAIEQAVDEWARKGVADGALKDMRVAPPFQWIEHTKDLPRGMGRVVHLTRRNHPFLGEHDRKCRIELANGKTRTFSLLPDGGSVSKTDVFVLQAGNRQFLRLRDDDQTDIAIALDTLKLCSPAGLPEGELALTFPE